MVDIFTGSCLCGKVKYECTRKPESATYCHCDDCRKTTGSAFNVGVRVSVSDFKIISGEVKGYTKTADSGNQLTRVFCPNCGSPLFTRSPVHPDHVYIKAGSLDDPNIVQPKIQIWMSKKVPWAEIDSSLTYFPQNRTIPEKKEAQKIRPNV